MNKDQRIIAAANRRGFKARTLAGAQKFLRGLKFPVNSTPLYERGRKVTACALVKRTKSPSSWLNGLNSYPYRVAESRWAGGEHSTSWSIGDAAAATCENDRVWSSNGKWAGNNSHAHLTVTARAAKALRGNMIIGGLVTLDLLQVAPREFYAVWAEQSRGVSLKTVEGWIIRGHHVRGGTLEAARRKAAKARQAAVAAAVEQRDQARKDRQTFRDYARVWVSAADSLAAGNCPAGTEQMSKIICRALGGQVGAVRADILLKYRNDHFSRRAVAYAAAHH